MLGCPSAPRTRSPRRLRPMTTHDVPRFLRIAVARQTFHPAPAQTGRQPDAPIPTRVPHLDTDTTTSQYQKRTHQTDSDIRSWPPRASRAPAVLVLGTPYCLVWVGASPQSPTARPVTHSQARNCSNTARSSVLLPRLLLSPCPIPPIILLLFSKPPSPSSKAQSLYRTPQQHKDS